MSLLYKVLQLFSDLTCLRNPALWNHISMLAKFFFFNLFLVGFDVITDCLIVYQWYTFEDNLSQHWLYYLCELRITAIFLILLPIIARIFFYLLNLLRFANNSAKLDIHLESLPQLLLHLPLLHQLR